MPTKAKFKFVGCSFNCLVWTVAEGTTWYRTRYMMPGDLIAFPREDFWRKYALTDN